MKTRAGRITGLFAAITVLVILVPAILAVRAYHKAAAPLATTRMHAPAVRVIRHKPPHYLGIVTTNLAAFDQAARVRPNLSIRYLQWGKVLPLIPIRQAATLHAMSLIELEPRGVPLRSIANGGEDSYLRYLGRKIERTGDEIMLSFAPEMNARWYSWGQGHVSPALYVAAWRHVHTVITQAGARHVVWLWQVARQHARYEPLKDVWPGRKYVNMAGIDGYYTSPGSTFGSTFAPTIHAVRQLASVPVLISETAVSPAAHPVAKIPGLFAGCRRLGVAGFVWFDIAQNDGSHHQNRRLEEQPAALATYHREARISGWVGQAGATRTSR
jgi:hypothetical protein